MEMEIRGDFRTTGMGAVHKTAILDEQAGAWVDIDRAPGRRYLGRFNGFERYAVDTYGATTVARFYRSNRGNEYVKMFHAEDGDETQVHEFRSFEEADRWAAAQKKGGGQS